MPDSVKAGTLLHEVLHLVLDISGRKTEAGDEALVSTMASALHAFLRDNPAAVEWIAGRARS